MRKNRILFLVIGGLLLACQVNGNLSSLAPTPTTQPTITQTITQTATLEPFPTPPFLTLTPPAVTSCVVETGIDNGVLHIRSCPALSCRVMGYAHEGRAVTVETVKNGWAWIGNGWVYSRYLECEK